MSPLSPVSFTWEDWMLKQRRIDWVLGRQAAETLLWPSQQHRVTFEDVTVNFTWEEWMLFADSETPVFGRDAGELGPAGLTLVPYTHTGILGQALLLFPGRCCSPRDIAFIIQDIFHPLPWSLGIWCLQAFQGRKWRPGILQ